MHPFEVDSLHIAAFAAQLPTRVAPSGFTDVPVIPDGPVVFLASGALAKAAELIAAWNAPLRSTPIVALSSPSIPGFVNASTTVVAIAFGGDTPETLEAAREAAARGATVHAISVGGPLAEIAVGTGGTALALEANIPGPRWAFYDVVCVLGNLVDGARLNHDLAGITDLLKRRLADSSDPQGALQHIERAIDRRIALFCGAGPMLSIIARRMMAQVNENAKSPAFASAMPAAVYDEIAGFGQQGDLTRQVLSVIELRSVDDSSQDALRFDARRALLDEVVASISVIDAEGTSALARAIDVSVAGDYLSLLLAARAGVDPGPVPAIVDIKVAVASA